MTAVGFASAPPGLDGMQARELEAILRVGSRSFHLASRLLPARVRAPTLALYAFCRRADDMVDDAGSDRGARIGVERLRKRIERVYRGEGHDVVERAFAVVAERHAIPRALPDALAEGMEWDATGRRYETIEDVRAYGIRVAGTVGLMMTLIMGAPRERRVLGRACDLGVAMQLTNIARDVGEDARSGRLYLPAAWLEGRGVDAALFLASPRRSPGIDHVTARLLDDAERLYASADRGIAHLPVDCRPAIRAARLIYAAIGDVVRRPDFDAVACRAVVPLRRKLVLAARAVPSRTWRPRPLLDPPSAESTALVDAVMAAVS